jgi:hypothetical protein
MSQENDSQEKVQSGTSVALRIFGFIVGTIALLWLLKVLMGV